MTAGVNEKMREAVAAQLDRVERGLRSALSRLSSPEPADERLEDALNEVQEAGFLARRAFRLERNGAAPEMRDADKRAADLDDEIVRQLESIARLNRRNLNPAELRRMGGHLNELARLVEQE